MTRMLVGLAAGVLLAGCRCRGADDTGTPLDTFDTGPYEEALPDRVLFRTSTQSFNLGWVVALFDGRIWFKPNPETTGLEEDWALLGGTGLPSGADLPNFGVPDRIEEISVDGVHLTAISDTGAFYRGSDLTGDIRTTITWTDQWGGSLGMGPGQTTVFSTARGWDVADSHPLGVANYQDIDGTTHSVGLGVAHVYRLGSEGRRVFFSDWWLPADWSRQICGPDRGTFEAVNIGVSASTVFLVDARGALLTRLYDFDTGGENSLLTYSYVIDGPSGTTRKLPAEPWRLQPPVDGRITRRITIFQDGQGNAARVLRVEGRRDGRNGFFHKHIYDPEWSFEPTDLPLHGPLLDPGAAPPATDPDDHHLAGTLSSNQGSIGLEIVDFNVVCSPATAHLLVGGEPVAVDGAPLALPFHHVHKMVEEQRPVDFWLEGIPAFVQAALLVPDSIHDIDDPTARQQVEALLGDAEVINFTGNVLPDHVGLDEIPWSTPFLVPAEEKALFDPFTLEASETR